MFAKKWPLQCLFLTAFRSGRARQQRKEMACRVTKRFSAVSNPGTSWYVDVKTKVTASGIRQELHLLTEFALNS